MCHKSPKRGRQNALGDSITQWESLTKQRKVHQCRARRLGKEIKEIEGVLASDMRKLGLNAIEVSEARVLTLEARVRLG